MPNRILKESICTSDTIDGLTWYEEAFFYRLIVNCDDYGRADARPAILKAKLFPLRDSVTKSNIEKALNKLLAVGLVSRYEVNDRPYLQLVTWAKYQQIRNKKSKFPSPEETDVVNKCSSSADDFTSSDNNCNQLISNVPVIQSNSNQSESETESEYKHGADKSDSEPVVVISLALNDKSLYGITQEHIEHWSELYPAVDVLQELRKMQGWLEANPTRRKTKKGILSFITRWLAKTQDKGGAPHDDGGGKNIGNAQNGQPKYGTVL